MQKHFNMECIRLSNAELAALYTIKSSWQSSSFLNTIVPSGIHTLLKHILKSNSKILKNELVYLINKELRKLSTKIVNFKQRLKNSQDKLKLEINELRNEVVEIKRNMNISSNKFEKQLTTLRQTEKILSGKADRHKKRLNVAIFGVNKQTIQIGNKKVFVRMTL